MYYRDAQKELNKIRANDPKPGDYWSECFCGVCVVLAVENNRVTYCSTRKDVDRNHWTWDLDAKEIKTIEQFKKWLSYDSIDGYWADVQPEAHKWVLTQ